MAQVVSRWPLTVEAQVHGRNSPHVICGGQSGMRPGFSPSSSVFPSVSFHLAHRTRNIIWGMNSRLLGAMDQRQSLTPLTWSWSSSSSSIWT